jgi:hypothetical protein
MAMRLASLFVTGAAGITLWPVVTGFLRQTERRRPPDLTTSAAIHHSDPAAALVAGTCGAVREAGPQSMRDDDGQWDLIDEASDQSFPASDPPARY